MHAYEYGLQRFKQRYQNTAHLTVFNDIVAPLNATQHTTPPLPEGVYAFIKKQGNNVQLLTRKTPLKAAIVQDYLIPTGQIIPQNINVQLPGVPGNYETFSYGEEELVYIPQGLELEEVVILGTSKIDKNTEENTKQKRLPELIRLPEQLVELGISIFAFVSDDGAKIERAYQQIDEVLAKEIVLFIENDIGNNLAGSVTRVKIGAEIPKIVNISYQDLAKVFKYHEVEITPVDLKELIKDAIAYNDSLNYYVQKGVSETLRLVLLPSHFVLEEVADVMDFIAKEITEALKLPETRWKVYSEEGNIDPNYNPLLPGKEWLTQKASERKAEIDEAKMLAPFQEIFKQIEKHIDDALEAWNIGSLGAVIKARFETLKQWMQLIEDFIKQVLKYGVDFIIAQYYRINATLVGIINSLVDAVAGIFQLLSFICRLVIAIGKSQLETISSPASQISLFLELLENMIDSVWNLISLKNVKALLDFQIKILVALAKDPTLGITSDKVGYAYGYIIGFLIEEVIFSILTGGAKTIAEAITKMADAFTSLLNGIYKTTRKVAILSIDLIIDLFAALRKIAKNAPKALDDLFLWIQDKILDVQVAAVLSVNQRLLGAYPSFTIIALSELTRVFKFVIKKETLSRLATYKLQFLYKNDEFVFLFKEKEVFRGDKAQAKLKLKEILEELKKGNLGRYLDEVASSIGKTANIIYKGEVIAKFTRGKELELIGENFKKIYGNSIIKLKSDATVSITGLLEDVREIKKLGKEKPDLWKQGINIGGTDLLSSPIWFKIRETYKDLEKTNPKLYWKNVIEDFWNQANRPWLDDIIERGDDVRFVTDPKLEKSKYVYLKKEKIFPLGIDGKKVRTIFSREVEYLLNNGYKIEGEIAIKIKK